MTRERWQRGAMPTRASGRVPPDAGGERKRRRQAATDADYLGALEGKGEGLTVPEIVDALGEDRASKSTAADALAALADAGKLERSGEGKKGSPYRYRHAG